MNQDFDSLGSTVASNSMRPSPRRSADLSELAVDYGEARRVQLMRRGQYRSFRCEYRDEDTAPCYMFEVNEESCPSCQRRAPLYSEWRASKTAETKALRRLRAALLRAHEGR